MRMESKIRNKDLKMSGTFSVVLYIILQGFLSFFLEKLALRVAAISCLNAKKMKLHSQYSNTLISKVWVDSRAMSPRTSS